MDSALNQRWTVVTLTRHRLTILPLSKKKQKREKNDSVDQIAKHWSKQNKPQPAPFWKSESSNKSKPKLNFSLKTHLLLPQSLTKWPSIHLNSFFFLISIDFAVLFGFGSLDRSKNLVIDQIFYVINSPLNFCLFWLFELISWVPTFNFAAFFGISKVELRELQGELEYSTM